MPSFVEKFYPLLISTLVTVLGYAAFDRWTSIRLRYDILSASIGISSITISLLIATLAILLAIDNSPVIRSLKGMGVYKELSTYLMSAVNASFTSAVISLFGLFIELKEVRQQGEILFVLLWLFTTSLAILHSHRVIFLLSKIINQHGQNNSP